MKLSVDIREVLALLEDCRRYNGCDHSEIDECCCYCQAKRIKKADDNDELEITDSLNIVEL